MIRYRGLSLLSTSTKVINMAITLIGESNSGGYAQSIYAKPSELDINENVQLFDNTTLNSFYPLKIGMPEANNMIGHVGLPTGSSIHGSDLQLSNYADMGTFGKKLYMLKCGQGGSRIEHWYNGGSSFYGLLNPWTTFVEREDGIKSLLPESCMRPVILFLGINDGIANTNPLLFRDHTISFINDMINKIGAGNKVYYVHMPRANASYAAIDDAISEIVNTLPYVRGISVDNAMSDMRDTNHFGYYGHKIITDKIVSQIKIDYNI